MSKLINLKKWFSVSDAAAYLTKSTGEAFSEADILALGMDGKINLSVRFSDEVPVEHEGAITHIRGLYDLEMKGDASAQVDRKIHTLIGGTKPDGYLFTSDFFVKDEGGKIFRLLEFDVSKEWVVAAKDGQIEVWTKNYDDSVSLNNYSPAFNLPKCAVLVIRSSEIARIVEVGPIQDRQKSGAGESASIGRDLQDDARNGLVSATKITEDRDWYMDRDIKWVRRRVEVEGACAGGDQNDETKPSNDETKPSQDEQKLGADGTAKIGRPSDKKRKGEVVCTIVKLYEEAIGNFDQGKMPQPKSDFHDACKRLEKSATGKMDLFGVVSSNTVADWLRLHGYRFAAGAPKGGGTPYTSEVVKIAGKIPPGLFR